MGSVMRRVFAGAIAGLLTSAAAGLPGLADTTTRPAELNSTTSTPPLLSLASIGYHDGIEFTGYEGRHDLFFAVPSGGWFNGMHLLLPYSAVSAGGGDQRTLTVMAGGKVLSQLVIGNTAGTVNIPVPRDAIDAGTLRATLIYSGGMSANRCADRRVGADHLRLDPGGGLAFDLTPGAQLPVAVTAALAPSKPTLSLPDRPTEAQAAAALTVLAARGGGSLTTEPNGSIRVAGLGDPALQSIDNAGHPALAIGGTDPAAAARAAFSGLAPLLGPPVIQRLVMHEHRPSMLTFGDLGADTRAINIAGEGGWTMALPASRLPAGKTVRGLSIDVTSVPDGAPRAASLSAWMNGFLLGSTALDHAGTTHLEVSVPDGSVHTLNGIEVRVTREDRANCGDVPRGWPVQLLGTSHVLLGTAGKVDAFHDFAAATAQGVTVVVPNVAALPLAGRAVAGLVGGDVPIRVAYSTVPAEGPVIYVGEAPPPGTRPALQVTNGEMILTDGAGQAGITLPDAGTQTIVQLLDAGGRQILWIRPAADGLVPASMWLDQGDVAVVAADGSMTPLSTRHDRLTPLIGPPPPPPWWQTYSSWIFMAAGLLIGILIVIWSFRPSVKKAKLGQEA